MFRMVNLIEKKRDGVELTSQEIEWIIEQFTQGHIPDYQMSAMAMAILFQGMTHEELGAMTLAMAKSGDQFDLSAIHGIKVDKHSTGGVGDTTTLVLAPLVASVGVPVAKMSGRGLGHTGGTIDKLEAIPGFKVEVSEEEFIHLVNTNHIAIAGQSGNLTPADKKLYALRDVTGTVQSIPLIASSIMSKKIASGADAIVLDVKVGAGAFMKTVEEAEQLAREMVAIGKQVGRQTMAIISNMDQPLGVAVGNANEVIEAIETLKGNGPSDLTELCLVLGSQMVYLASGAKSIAEAREKLEENIRNGKALDVLKTFISSQGGDASIVDDVTKLPQAKWNYDICAKTDGYVTNIVANDIGVAAMMLGAGRATKESEIDLSVGVSVLKKVGDAVKSGDVLAKIHTNRTDNEEVIQKIQNAYTIGDICEALPLIYKVVTE
ncbi:MULTISPECIES: pyrimidine-nucleoside phosphorylase [unclassified Granulicatella]|uniref:pyrimidine-nucleoside phosphorylase n=1 Tax=unclassified Granulicatella TaxID=2630493 RepID=UPI0010736D49|nr:MULTISPECIES: pyrimidine-nucleoside phosphorylase [unclassified Granulicatella]MBF0780089.1 pyrimidine-nucleoside phosphorylase [Granulicatella sp. 19428wC4_WM01]TFU95815.1 pyrimidine-nucleoside phosphorylase [Granulicatella sp. WM01]